MRAKTKTCFSHHEDSYRQSSHSAVAALIGSNDDLLTEILVCLPVKPIFRFKCVSKHLRSLLSHTRFTLRYDTKHFRKSPLGLFASTCVYDNEAPRFCTPINMYVPFDDNEDRTDPPFHNLDFFSDPKGIDIQQSCNGLLLCRSCLGCAAEYKYYVFNPTTKQFVIIPSVPGGEKVFKRIRCMGMAFHQTDCAHYKVVCIIRLGSLETKPVEDEDEDEDEYEEDEDEKWELFQIQTYSSDTCEWKISIESFSASKLKLNYDSGVYWNGAINWAIYDRSYMYFKLDAEQLHLLPLPAEVMSFPTPAMWFPTPAMYLGESRGHLYLIVYNQYINDPLPLKVYEMSMDHSGWFVKYHVEFDVLKELRPFWMRFKSKVTVIDVIRGEKDEDTSMVLKIYGLYITYNVHDKSFHHISKLNDFYNRSLISVSTTFCCYIQTLASF